MIFFFSKLWRNYGDWTHGDRMTHICVSKLIIIGLSPRRHLAIIWTNAAVLLIRPLGAKFGEIAIEIHTFSFRKMHLKMSSAQWRPFFRGLNVLSKHNVTANRLHMYFKHRVMQMSMITYDKSVTSHCIDVIMTTMASQITSLTVVYSIVYSEADQRKHQSSSSLAFVWRIHRDRWIPRTKGQLRGKCFHLMTSSCTHSKWELMLYWSHCPTLYKVFLLLLLQDVSLMLSMFTFAKYNSALKMQQYSFEWIWYWSNWSEIFIIVLIAYCSVFCFCPGNNCDNVSRVYEEWYAWAGNAGNVFPATDFKRKH